MKGVRWLALLAALGGHAASGSPSDRLSSAYLLPEWALRPLSGAGIAADDQPATTDPLTVSRHVNPFYLQGDFDGDCRIDLAVLVRNRTSGDAGIAIVLRASDRVEIRGAGEPAGNGGTNFNWLDAWQVFPKGPVERGVEEGPPPRLLGDALLVENSEAASAIIYFNGQTFEWYQQGD